LVNLVAHLFDVISSVAYVKVEGVVVLMHPVVHVVHVTIFTDSRTVRNGERFGSVDFAIVFRAVSFFVGKVSVRLASTSVALPPVVVSGISIASVHSRGEGILVSFECVVFGAPLLVSVVGITVVITTISNLLANHSIKVGSGVAVAANCADIGLVAEVVVQ
jgi:hypothetical protein